MVSWNRRREKKKRVLKNSGIKKKWSKLWKKSLGKRDVRDRGRRKKKEEKRSILTENSKKNNRDGKVFIFYALKGYEYVLCGINLYIGRKTL